MLFTDDAWAGIGHGSGVGFVNEPASDSVPPGTLLDRPGSFFRRHREGGQDVSLLEGTLVTTGEQRLMVQRFVRPASVSLDAPLAIAVSRRVDALYAPWRRGTVVLAILYLALVSGAVVAMSVMRRRDRALLDLQRRSAERVEMARRGADLGLWDQDLVKRQHARRRALVPDAGVAVRAAGPRRRALALARASAGLAARRGPPRATTSRAAPTASTRPTGCAMPTGTGSGCSTGRWWSSAMRTATPCAWPARTWT